MSLSSDPARRSVSTLLYGRDEPPAPVRLLHAGAYTAMLDGCDLRYVRFGSREIVRRLYFAVRDHNWNTLPSTITATEITEPENGFTLRLQARCEFAGGAFVWAATITGDHASGITYAFEGAVAEGPAFRYNRIGLCVLHPPAETCGQAFEGITAGETVRGTFPVFIGEQAIKDGVEQALFAPVSALRIGAREGDVRFAFTGDLFETEDQRNWTDDSFKTYCTPLALPFPRSAKPGEAVRQSVHVQFHARDFATPPPPPMTQETFARNNEVRVRVLPNPVRLPRLGLALAEGALGPEDTRLLAALRPHHLRVDCPLWDLERTTNDLRRAQAFLEVAPNTGLEIAVFVSSDAEQPLARFADLLRDTGVGCRVHRVLVFHADEEATQENASWVQLARRFLAPVVAPDAAFFGGTDQYFCQLNRARFNPEAVNGVAYSVNGQTHAFDERSLAEGLAAQADTVRSARAKFAPRNLPVCVSPVTLRPRFNPNATGAESPSNSDTPLPRSVDTRQMSLWAATWTLGSVAAFATAGADAVTYFETHGMKGIIAGQNTVFPPAFPAKPHEVFPMYQVFADITELRNGDGNTKEAEWFPCESGEPLSVVAFAGRNASGWAFLLAGNLSDTPRTVCFDLGAFANAVTCRRWNLETDNRFRYRAATTDISDMPTETLAVHNGCVRLQLTPCETVRIRWGTTK